MRRHLKFMMGWGLSVKSEVSFVCEGPRVVKDCTTRQVGWTGKGLLSGSGADGRLKG